jgi:hypothetical protein
VYVLPWDDFGVFTAGRPPLYPDARQSLEDRAELACTELAGQPRPVRGLPFHRDLCATGRFEVRRATSAAHIREHPRPSIDPEQARIELCRRHAHAVGPTTPAAFAWWAGVPSPDAKRTVAVITQIRTFTPQVPLHKIRSAARVGPITTGGQLRECTGR